jgi:phage-related protein
MKAFEMHTYQSGKWKIDTVFDDSDLAMFEAQRMDESGRCTSIRVVEEIYVESTQETKTRTIFRGSKIAAANAEQLRKSKENRQNKGKALQKAQEHRCSAQKGRTEAENQDEGQSGSPDPDPDRGCRRWCDVRSYVPSGRPLSPKNLFALTARRVYTRRHDTENQKIPGSTPAGNTVPCRRSGCCGQKLS